MNDVFQGLYDFYDDQVKEADESGYADLFKKASQIFFKDVRDKGYTVEDIDYRDGYYIFGTGTNSVVHFKIKECPKWLFGIWFDVNEKGDVTGQFFGQCDPIDKFKPTASDYNATMQFNINDTKTDFDRDEDGWFYYIDENVFNAFEFIHKHPLRAWNYHYHGYDYNYRHVSDIKLLLNLLDYKFYRWKKDCLGDFLSKSLCRYLIKLVTPFLNDMFLLESYQLELHDSGEFTSPRYDLQCRIQDNSFQETGLYYAFDPESEEEVEAEKKYKKREKLYRDIMNNIFGIWWYPDIEPDIVFWKQCEWDENGEYIGEEKD